MTVKHVAIPCLTIPRVAHGKLHEPCMFHATTKHGPRKHVTGMNCRFLVAPCMDMLGTVKLYVVEQYTIFYLALAFGLLYNCIVAVCLYCELIYAKST